MPSWRRTTTRLRRRRRTSSPRSWRRVVTCWLPCRRRIEEDSERRGRNVWLVNSQARLYQCIVGVQDRGLGPGNLQQFALRAYQCLQYFKPQPTKSHENHGTIVGFTAVFSARETEMDFSKCSNYCKSKHGILGPRHYHIAKIISSCVIISITRCWL